MILLEIYDYNPVAHVCHWKLKESWTDNFLNICHYHLPD